MAGILILTRHIMSNIGKRFTDPGVWEQPYFTELDTKQRLFWLYLNNRCDLAGVFQLHFPVDSAFLGFKIDRPFIKAFLKALNSDAERIEPLKGQRLWLKGFVRYQQVGKEGSLSAKSPPHKSIVRKLKEHGLFQRAVKEDTELFSNYTGKTQTDEINNDSKGNATLRQGYAKGYSNSLSNGKSSNNGKSYSSSPSALTKAESLLKAYPKKNKNGSDISVLATIEDVLKSLTDDGIKDPSEYLFNQIKELDRRNAPPPEEFFNTIKNGSEIPF